MGAINVADILTMQDLANGHLDIKALGEAANGDENTIVTTRTGNTYPSAERAINIMFQNGGLPAKPFKTKAAMTASALVDGDYAIVTDDTYNNNGLYQKSGSAWAYSKHNTSATINAIDVSVNSLASDYNGVLYDIYSENTNANTNLIYVRAKEYFYLAPSGKVGLLKQWSSVLSDLSTKTDKIGVSAKGVVDCVKLTGNDALVYVLATLKFDVISRDAVKLSEHVLLAQGSYGRIRKGYFYDIRQTQIGAAAAYFYWANGYKSTSLPYIEQADDSDAASTAAVYIKFNDVARLRLLDPPLNLAPEWSTVIADITAQSPNSIVTSKKGVSQCIMLKDTSLVFDLYAKKYRITPTNYHDPANEILLATGIFGQLVGGIIRDWWLTKNVNNLLAGGSVTPPPPSAATNSKRDVTPQPKYIVHGGMNGFNIFAPYNTIPAYIAAGEYGYWGAECDLVETLDGEWVLCHDLSVNEYTYGSGWIREMTLAQIKELDATKKSAAYGWAGVPVAELGEYLEVCVKYNLVPVMEFKSIPTAAGVQKILTTINKYMSESDCYLISFDLAVLQLVRSLSATMPLMLISAVLTTANINAALALGNCVLSVGVGSSKSDVVVAKKAGLEVGFWTPNQQTIDSDLAMGYDYITTDIGIPSNFDKGAKTLNFKNSDTFSNLTSIGAGTVTAKVLTVPSGESYLDVTVNQGDVITVSCEAKAIGTSIGSLIKVDALNMSGSVIRTYTQRAISSKTFTLSSAAAVAYDVDVVKIRVSIGAGTSGAAIRGLRIKKFEV